MSQNPLETEVGAFEVRMAMRRKMRELCGAPVERGVAPPLDERERGMITACFECRNAQVCIDWLLEQDDPTDAPGFCPNARELDLERASHTG
ncbi:MAG: hypothetical protein HUJ27_06490 [Rhodobacteraceae bacterium]|nr:hypothetical protein [Paracoccaceae bacterium]